MSGIHNEQYNMQFSFPSPQGSPKVLANESNERYQVVCEGKLKKFICLSPGCEKTFRFKSEIERHLSAHSDIRPHQCKYPGCKKSFKRIDALDDHVRSQHTGEAPLVCPYPDCGERFSTTAKLRYHTALHEDQKPYKCAVSGCDRGFVTLSQLRQHEKSSLAHRKLGLTPDRKRSYMSNQSPAPTFYPSETEEPGMDLMSEAKKRVKYDSAVNPAVDYDTGFYGEHGLPQHIMHDVHAHAHGHGHDAYNTNQHMNLNMNMNLNNNVQLAYENIKLDEPVVEKKEFLTNVLGENEVLKKRLNYTENMIHTMKGQLDKVMLLLPNRFDHMRLLGYKQEAASKAHLDLAGLPDSLLPEVDNFFL